MNQILQHLETGPQNFHIAPEFVDNQTLDMGLLLRLQQGDGAVETGKDAAPVDVTGQQHRRAYHTGHAHVDEIIFLEVDFRGTARALNDDNIVFRRQGIICLPDGGAEVVFVGVILGGFHVAQDFTVDNDLTAHIAGGLQEDGIHPHIGGNPGGFGLHNLGPAHFKARVGDKAVEGHVLTFERGHLVAVLMEHAAQAAGQQAFSGVGHGALNHNGLCHGHSSIHWLTAASNFSLSGAVRTATR